MRRTLVTWTIIAALACPGGPVAGVRPARSQEWQTHKVARGENLTLIANRYRVTVQELRDWNELRSDELAIGQKLRIPQQDLEWYVVKPGDNLTEIAGRHRLPVDFLRKLNGLRSSTIHPGQKLRLLPSPVDEAVHVVRRGDSLSRIAQRHGTTIQRLQGINDLKDDRIFVGQQLRLREASAAVHIVERGDALWEIAAAYGITLARLKELNGLVSDQIYPGQELRLDGDSTPKLASYTVARGDNLNEIARLHQMSLHELRGLNGIKGSLIRPGQKLKVRPLLGGSTVAGVQDKAGGKPAGNAAGKAAGKERSGDGSTGDGNAGGEETDGRDLPAFAEALDWAGLTITVPNVARLEPENGPYFFHQPRAPRQSSGSYCEESPLSPAACYRNACLLLDHFDRTLQASTPLSDRLKGWTIVLDPGHGGIDPGTIVSGTDASGEKYYVVEDEYCYDLALRIYALLRLHGASATMTVLSPNHLLRGNSPQTSTFVHDRNEVFNDPDWNRSTRQDTHPMGGQKYLDQRKAIARRALKDAAANRTLFLSFHADNDPESGNVFSLFYFQNRSGADTASRDFAGRMLPAMGAGARTRGRNFGVLRQNPARFKLLVEMRNLAFDEHVWAIRYEQLRQRDAEKVVKALLDAVEGLDPLARN